MTVTEPIAPGVFTWPSDDPRLIGSQCTCGVVTFPTQQACPRCGTPGMQHVELSARGTLWTWTSQGFPLKEPYNGPDEPFLLGYVELPEGLRVETRLVDVVASDVTIGMEMELTIVPFRRDGDVEVLTYAFRPVAG